VIDRQPRIGGIWHDITLMKRSLCAILAWVLAFAVVSPITVAEAGPFKEFFRALRSAVGHPDPTPRPHRSRHRSSQKHNETPPSDASNNQASSTAAPAPLDRHDVRVAKAASTGSEQKTDLPYGTPVAGKPGLVTSPFAQDKGYVDVTGFPHGTEVQDPYTGKTFLTP
jgi:hypothetical protein